MKGHFFGRVGMASEAGFGLVEVMVTAVVIVLVATATVSSIGASQKASAKSLSRGVTANLAEQDQERMRTMRAKDLADYTATNTYTLQGVTYRVDSRSEFVTDNSGDTVSCTSTGAQTSYLRLTSTVTPVTRVSDAPLTMRSIMPLPVTQYSPTSGTLIVPVAQADGDPQPNITVSLSGPESRTATTNAKGCAIFQFLTPGAYTITLNQAAFVDPGLNSKVTYSGTVSPGNINTATPQLYDLWGSIVPSFDNGPTRAAGITVSHTSLTAPKSRTFPVAGATGLFPFTSAYAVYSGTCAANDPTAYSGAAAAALVPPTSPATAVPVTLHEPVLTPPSINVLWQDTSGGQKTEVPSKSGDSAKIYIKPADTGCTLASNPVVTVDNTTGAPTSTVNLPYGNYKLCAEYNKTKQGNTKVTGTYSQVASYTALNKGAGVSGLATVTIDTQAGSGATNKLACSARTTF